MKQLWAVVCGNIRSELDFKLTLTKLVVLRSNNKIHHILISTWKNEIDKYEGLRETLKSLDIYVVESNPLTDEIESTESISVNYWRQARQLLLALDFIPKNSFVLRVRSDRSLNYINQMEKLGVFDNYMIKTVDFGKFPKIFEYKVFIFGPKTVRLMHMIDFAFLGYSKDLYKMINFDYNELKFQKTIVANAQWFMYPFIQEFPILRDYIRFTLFKNSIKVLKEYVDANKNDSDFPEVYYKVYAIYLLIMFTHFKILYLGEINDEVLNKASFYQLFTSSERNNLYATTLGTSIRNEKFLKKAVEGGLQPSKSYSRFMYYVNTISAYGNDENFCYSYADFLNLEEFVKSNKYCDNTQIKWYKKIVISPVKLNINYKKDYNINALNCLSVDNEVWNELLRNKNIERTLLNKWVGLNQFNDSITEKMLLPVAKTGIESAIYVLLDLLINNRISLVNIDEVIRVSEFYLNISINKKTNTDFTLRILFKYLMLVQNGLIEKGRFNLVNAFNCTLSKYKITFNNEYNDFVSELSKLSLDLDVSISDKYLFLSILDDIGEGLAESSEGINSYYQNIEDKLVQYMVFKPYLLNGK